MKSLTMKGAFLLFITVISFSKSKYFLVETNKGKSTTEVKKNDDANSNYRRMNEGMNNKEMLYVTQKISWFWMCNLTKNLQNQKQMIF